MSEEAASTFNVGCDVVGCDGTAEIVGSAALVAAAAAYDLGSDALPDGWLPEGWRAHRIPIVKPQLMAISARLSEIEGAGSRSFYLKPEIKGHYTFTICPAHAADPDPTIVGPWPRQQEGG